MPTRRLTIYQHLSKKVPDFEIAHGSVEQYKFKDGGGGRVVKDSGHNIEFQFMWSGSATTAEGETTVTLAYNVACTM